MGINTAAEIENDRNHDNDIKRLRELAEYDFALVEAHRDLVIKFRDGRLRYSWAEMAQELADSELFGNFICDFLDGSLVVSPGKYWGVSTAINQELNKSAFYQCKHSLEGEWENYQDLLDAKDAD